MGKARSSRRMRNCKSRTKRGGGFGSWFEDKLLTEFKAAIRGDVNTLVSFEEFKQRVKSDPEFNVTEPMEKGIKIALDDTSGMLYSFFNRHNFNELYSSLVENSLYNLIEQSKEGKKYYEEVLAQAKPIFYPQDATGETQQESVAHLPSRKKLQAFGLERPQEAQEVLPKLERDTKHMYTSPPLYPYSGFGPIKRKPKNPIEGMDETAYENLPEFKQTDDPAYTPPSPPKPFTDPRFKPQPVGNGGSKRRPKSSRRHRRVKFGKSKKGRTTRRIVRKHRR